MKPIIPLLITLLVALTRIASAAEPSAAAANEVRILIDTSGSMKKTDPQNLRVPALKLLINLLPAGTQTGIWLFDSKPQILTAPTPVDDDWKTNTLTLTSQINSRGLFTDIEAVLKVASQDWTTPVASPGLRHVILLTDGMVDISKNPADNKSSSERIHTEVLPHLQQAGAQLHTIALSAESDQDLMRELALATGGWNETANEAEGLQRIFVKMFNKAAPHDNVPLNDNQFSVDGNIKEFTVLALLHPGSKPTRLIAPDQSAVTQNDPLMNTKWVHEEGYDLITIPQPAAGNWKLEADVDPDNQVLVITNLKMMPVPMPSYLTPDEQASVSVQFTENDQPIVREDFLSLITIKASIKAGEHLHQEATLQRDLSQPVLFIHQFQEHLEPGEYSLSLTADGKTFQREYSQTFKVIYTPITMNTESITEGETNHTLITLTPDVHVIDLENLIIHARLTDSHGQSAEAEVTRNGEHWQLALNPLPPGEKLIANFTVTAKSPEGQELHFNLKPLTVGEPAPEHPAVHHEESPTPADEHPAAPEAPPAASAMESTTVIALAIGVNLVVGLAGYLIYRYSRKRSAAAIDNLLNQLTP